MGFFLVKLVPRDPDDLPVDFLEVSDFFASDLPELVGFLPVSLEFLSDFLAGLAFPFADFDASTFPATGFPLVLLSGFEDPAFEPPLFPPLDLPGWLFPPADLDFLSLPAPLDGGLIAPLANGPLPSPSTFGFGRWAAGAAGSTLIAGFAAGFSGTFPEDFAGDSAFTGAAFPTAALSPPFSECLSVPLSGVSVLAGVSVLTGVTAFATGAAFDPAATFKALAACPAFAAVFASEPALLELFFSGAAGFGLVFHVTPISLRIVEGAALLGWWNKSFAN